MLKMLGKGIAIKPFKKEEKTVSGVIIPESVVGGREKNSLNQGKVVSIGKDVEEVKKGDVVIYVEGTYWKNNKRKNIDEYKIDGEELILVLEHEVKAIIEL